MKHIAVQLYISGRVQGVNYRYSTVQQAVSLGVHGWVRNLSDGRVEAFLEGEQKAVDKLVDWCHHGPPMAHITNVELHKKEYSGKYDDFTVKV